MVISLQVVLYVVRIIFPYGKTCDSFSIQFFSLKMEKHQIKINPKRHNVVYNKEI